MVDEHRLRANARSFLFDYGLLASSASENDRDDFVMKKLAAFEVEVLHAARADELQTFLNRVKLLISLDQHEVKMRGGVYEKFSADPFRFLIRCDDPTQAAIWAAIVKRETR